MINFAIRCVKRNPFLYNLAKRILANLNHKKSIALKEKKLTYFAFVLKDLEELPKIKEKYEKIRRFDTKLFILIDNPSYNILMHKFIRDNNDICFSSLDYFKRYDAKISNNRIIWFDLSADNTKILDCFS